MKITLEPTVRYDGMEQPPTVVISTTHDDLSMGEFVDLVRRAAIAWGFLPEVVKQYIPEE